MKKSHARAALFLSGAVIGLAPTTPALAQAGSELGEIVVTARRVEERLQDVPISIAVYNQAQIDARNIVSGVDLATYTPSLTVNQRYGPETSSFAIRGFLQEANTAPSVGVYFADVTTPRALGVTSSGSNLPIGSFMDLENTQILKGPQGTLFGRNTTGGAILLVPKRPSDRQEGYLEVSGGNRNMWRVQGVLNMPLGDKVRVRLGVDRQKSDGYMKNYSGIGPDDYNDTDYIYGRFSMVIDLTSTLENYTVAHLSKSETNGFGARIEECARTIAERQRTSIGLFIAPMACPQIDRRNARGDSRLGVDINVNNPYFKVTEWQAINHTTWQASPNLTVKNIISYSEYTNDLNYSLGGENFRTASTGLPLPIPLTIGTPFWTTLISSAPGFRSSDQWTFTEELQFQGNAFDNRLEWQAGGYLEIARAPDWNNGWTNVFLSCSDLQIPSLQCFDPFQISPTFSISSAKTRSSFDNKALYAQGTYKVTDKLRLTAGIRYTWDKLKGTDESTRFRFPLTAAGPSLLQVCTDNLRFRNPNGTALTVTNSVQCHKSITAKSDKPTWVFDADYKVTDDAMVYAKYARGYRAGGVALGNVGLEVWQPEKLDTYEIGLKTSFHGAVSGYLNAAAFYNDFQDQQLNGTFSDRVTGQSLGPAIVNAGSSTIKGIEIDAAIRLLDSLDLSVGYSYLKTKIKKLEAPVSQVYNISLLALEGDPLPQVPPQRFTATATYTLPLDENIGRISFGATFTHTDKQFYNRNSPAPYVYLPRTDLLNLNANWNDIMGRPIDLALFMTNVTNEAIHASHSGSFSSLGYESVSYGQPRTYGMRLRYKFGN